MGANYMLIKYLPGLYERCGAIKFTILYGIIFSTTVNLLSITFLTVILDDHFSINRIAAYLIIQFVVGIVLAQHVIRRIKSGEI